MQPSNNNAQEQPMQQAPGKQRRGFAAMSKEQRTRIATMGGKASHGSRKKSV